MFQAIARKITRPPKACITVHGTDIIIILVNLYGTITVILSPCGCHHCRHRHDNHWQHHHCDCFNSFHNFLQLRAILVPIVAKEDAEFPIITPSTCCTVYVHCTVYYTVLSCVVAHLVCWPPPSCDQSVQYRESLTWTASSGVSSVPSGARTIPLPRGGRGEWGKCQECHTQAWVGPCSPQRGKQIHPPTTPNTYDWKMLFCIWVLLKAGFSYWNGLYCIGEITLLYAHKINSLNSFTSFLRKTFHALPCLFY